MRHLIVATSAALLSLGAVAGAPQAANDSSVIREARDALRAQGYAATPQGLRKFQQAQGIEPSGKLDQKTMAALGVGASASSSASSEQAPRPGKRAKY
jgi:hypothetical protein